MKSSLKDLPIRVESAERVARAIDWGGMHVYTAEIHETSDHSPESRGPPDEDCQCRHWGYVLKGQIRFEVDG